MITAVLSVSLGFALLWLWSRKIKNYSWVDAAWAFGIGACSVSWLLANPGLKQWAAGLLISCWSLRLSYHLQRRILKHHPEEDSRYAELRESWSPTGFFFFFQAQAILVILMALPFYFIARDSSPWGAFERIGGTTCLIGLIGELISDRQMTQFKEKNADPKAVCQEGLWKYSRHPNYFFESVIWTGFYLFASGSAHGYWTIHAPLIITFLLLKITGIPPTEKSAVARKGDAYREYQRTTSPFIPLPPSS